jgi:hypothetical protein
MGTFFVYGWQRILHPISIAPNEPELIRTTRGQNLPKKIEPLTTSRNESHRTDVAANPHAAVDPLRRRL